MEQAILSFKQQPLKRFRELAPPNNLQVEKPVVTEVSRQSTTIAFFVLIKNVPIGDKNPIQDKTGQRPCLLCLYLLSKFQWGLWYTNHHLPQSRPACIAERHSWETLRELLVSVPASEEPHSTKD